MKKIAPAGTFSVFACISIPPSFPYSKQREFTDTPRTITVTPSLPSVFHSDVRSSVRTSAPMTGPTARFALLTRGRVASGDSAHVGLPNSWNCDIRARCQFSRRQHELRKLTGLALQASHPHEASSVPARDLSRIVRMFRRAVLGVGKHGAELPNCTGRSVGGAESVGEGADITCGKSKIYKTARPKGPPVCER